ncbi:acetate--CoA ligase family protein [Pontibaca salina]|uniref:Acetate--CoA ligase family protein n=1 Tax=Pontibaca salina TaxID=2795731 RepID=A0A934HRS8_9RHOB|nr:acetate--CoA ligase family protein [Pontibaca salina]MBI6630572.1 acetate--CoA ligase family protein [Pontibaca salina]
MRDLCRLLNPRSIAVIGGGAWCASIINAAQRIEYRGVIVPVHPDKKEIAGLRTLPRLGDYDGPIDAAFLGINRHATVAAVAALADMNAGGAVCFASGFTEAQAEDETGDSLQAALVAAAGKMPILGPNCYGFVNALDRTAIWPDQHGMEPVERGVAILTQSSNIAINLTMQQRTLPIAYMVTCGNMAQTSQAAIAMALLDDKRVTAIGLHVEGFGKLREWEALARKARAHDIPLVALKVGRSDQARSATVSHTASLAGTDSGAQALLDRLCIARLNTLPEFLETLKLLHCTGRLASSNIASISCSGGEASLIADLALAENLHFPPLEVSQKRKLQQVLGPMVAVANPLDYHTYIWRDAEKMTRIWGAMTGPDIALTLSIVDYPHTDAADWACATQAALDARAQTGAPFAVVATLPELMPPHTARQLMNGGVVPLNGLAEALAAIRAAAAPVLSDADALILPGTAEATQVLDEDQAKSALGRHGLTIPLGRTADDPTGAASVAADLTPPLVLKGLGLAHKSEYGAVRLNLEPSLIETTAAEIGTDRFLIEEMVAGGVAELLIGIIRDPAHGFILTLGAGGILTEILRDTVSLLVPSTREQIHAALMRLRCAPLLTGYRGRPSANIPAILDAVAAVQSYIVANADTVAEVEVNPLISTPDRAVAVDALIRKA